MKIAMISPSPCSITPMIYGLRESVVSLLTEGLAGRGIDVALFPCGDSQNRGKVVNQGTESTNNYKYKGHKEELEGMSRIPESLNISGAFEKGAQFDLIHNHLDCLPLTYMGMTNTPVLTTIYGFSSPDVLPVYKKYNKRAFYIATSDADRNSDLDYIATIYCGIDLRRFKFRSDHGEYLLFLDSILPENGAGECIDIARQTGMKLIISGAIQDRDYFDSQVLPNLDGNRIIYLESIQREMRDELLGGAYALLHFSFNKECGFSASEAMACGTPVIALARGSMPEIISDGISGFLVCSPDEMAGAVARVNQIDRVKCRRWVEERFSADRMVNDYIRVYEGIIQQTRREDHRPWGFYEILSDAQDHKVKRITVYPGQRLSYQHHFRRSEHWYVISGKAVATKNGKNIEMTSGQALDVPVGTWHRISNAGQENMVFIEVQTGDYFGEDDIERLEDDYGRA
ncbi:glycosyltransferase [bacterium]|nr:glycosyltransferase [bacterium]